MVFFSDFIDSSLFGHECTPGAGQKQPRCSTQIVLGVRRGVDDR
jgi:hypothetical protein